MLRPPKLHKNDQIRILSTARKLDIFLIQTSIDWINSLGYRASLGKTLTLGNHQYAGTDEERALDFQDALDDPNVKAIWFARGGYGSIRILDLINWEKFIAQPKWLIGFSDMTIWHSHINQFFGIQTLHAIMPLTFAKNSDLAKSLLADNLAGNYMSIDWENNSYNHNIKEVEGEIIGGNLSILYSLIGTKSGFNSNGKILFIEEIDEYLYHIDRMMISMKQAGKLAGLKAILVGGFTDIKDNEIPFGKSYQEIIIEHCSEYGFPIIFDFPAGHIDDHRPLILGSNIRLSQEKSMKLNYL